MTTTTTAATTHVLKGCKTTPIGSYLKALGVLRIVSEQLDPDAVGSWVGDTFHLRCRANADELTEFFVERYSPTPLVSPWNGGSGFSPKDKGALKAIEAILTTTDARFAPYRHTIEVARRLVADPHWEDGGKDAKRLQIERCRGAFPDEAVTWLDASVVLANDRAVFPPLFGTGGNDGRLEFSKTFMERIVKLLVSPPGKSDPSPSDALRDTLFATGLVPLVDVGGGQYDPASVEPDASASTGRSSSLANLWDFILLIEGALLFASGAARRLGGGSDLRAAMPFCVDSSAVGYGSAAEDEETRGEVWAPIWSRPATLADLARLIGEGRARWDRRQASSGTDFAKAAATFGVDRGIDRFVRHGIAQRNGLAFLAVPIGEVRVGDRPQVDVLKQVDAWVARVKRSLPGAAGAAMREVDRAQFRAAAGSSGPLAEGLQQVLIAVAHAESVIARSSNRAELAPPVGGARTRMPAADWVPLLDDGTPEFRLAASLASAHDRLPRGPLSDHDRRVSSLALLLRAIELDTRGNVVWASGTPSVEGLGRRPLYDVLAGALVQRSIVSTQHDSSTDTDSSERSIAFPLGLPAQREDLRAMLEGAVDVNRIDGLLAGLLLLDWRREPGSRDSWAAPRPAAPIRQHVEPATPAAAALLPFFHGSPLAATGRDGQPIVVTLRPPRSWATQLARGGPAGLTNVLADALHRLRVEGLRPTPSVLRPTPGENGPVLAAAALCGMSSTTAERFLAQTCPPVDLLTP